MPYLVRKLIIFLGSKLAPEIYLVEDQEYTQIYKSILTEFWGFHDIDDNGQEVTVQNPTKEFALLKHLLVELYKESRLDYNFEMKHEVRKIDKIVKDTITNL